MTDFVFNARNSALRRVRLKPSLSSTSMLYSSSNCYLNSTPINNFVLPPSPPPCTFSPPSSLSTTKSTGRTLKPSLRKLEPIGSESNATTAIIKSVHFNDPLTRVVHFYTPPPLDAYDEDDEEETEEEETEEEENKLEDAFLELYMINGLQDECDSLAIAQPPANNSLAINNNKPNGVLSLPNWPLTIHPARRFISQMVSLENLAWNHLLQVVQGRVLVHNLVFEKKVTVRCSFDDWETWTDIDAYYKESAFDGGLSDVSSNSALDRFMFEIHVPNMHDFSCSIAVRYQTLGQEFWDNNNGNNFTAHSMPAGSTLGEKPLSFLKAIMQQEHEKNNNKEGLSIIPTLNLMEYHHEKDSNRHYHQEKPKQSCRHGPRDDIVSQQQPAKTTAKTRHLLDRFKFSKYGASKIPAAPVPTKKRSTMQQQQKIETQLVVVDPSEQQTGNCNDALIRSSTMDNHDEAVDLKETIIYA
ncbi:unnamed protein product [Mucor fragilis]